MLRWAFVGAIIAIITDLSDIFLMDALDPHLGGLGNYQSFDKYMDQVYLLTFLIVALRWSALPRNVAIALYGYRLVGFVAFEVTGARALLLFFPNHFEFWFVFVASLPHWRPNFVFTRGQVFLSLAPLLAVKEFQEYALHWGRWLDGFTAFDAVERIWSVVTAPF